MPNLLANAALLAWPLVTLALFATLRPRLAAVASILGAGLLLPSGLTFHIKGVPDFDRDTIASLSALAGGLLFARGLFATRPPPRGPEWLVLALVLAGFATALTNGDPRPIGARTLPGLAPWDGASRAADAILIFGVPFYLGRALFRSPRDLRLLLGAVAVAGLLYSIPILWESRMSPHLHYRLYGYQPADFAQAKRELFFGWRPMVFVGHGLTLSMFVVAAVVAAAGLWRAYPRALGRWTHLVPPYLYAVLVLCNSLAALVYGTVVAPVVAFTGRHAQRIAILCLVALILAYPALRMADLFPTRRLVEAAGAVSENRAGSLEYRFENEDMLLEHARKRMLFGWGSHGRDRIYDEQGNDISTTDGYWIIVFGQLGVVGFVLVFGLLLSPALLAARAVRRGPASGETYLVLALAWVLALSVLDLLPNAFLNARTVFFGGALTGAVQGWRRMPARRPRGRPAPRSRPSPPVREKEPERPPPRSLGEGLRRRTPRRG